MMEQDTQRAIGRLEGKLDALIDTVRVQGEHADTARTRAYARIETISSDIAAMRNRVDRAEEALETLEPAVAEFNRLKQRGLGILAMLTLFWLVSGALVLSAVTKMGAWVLQALAKAA